MGEFCKHYGFEATGDDKFEYDNEMSEDDDEWILTLKYCLNDLKDKNSTFLSPQL